LITFFVVFFVSGALLQTDNVREQIQKMLAEIIKKETGYRLEIADLRLYPSFQFTAKEVSLYNKENKIVFIDEIDGGLYPHHLIKRILHFYTLNASGVQFFDDTGNENNLNLKSIQGALFVNLQKELLKGDLTLLLESEPDKLITALGTLEKGSGNIQITAQPDIEFEAEFMVAQDKIFHLNRFHGSYETYALDGTATLTPDGIFKDSSLFFTSGELSESLPFKGYLYGEGKILGSLWAPELNIAVFSDELLIKETPLTNVQAKVLSHHSKKGLGGEASISFIKDGSTYEFSGRIFWEEATGPFPSKFKAKTNLAEMAQIFNIETSSLSGDIEIVLTFKDKDIKGTASLKNGQFESYELGSLLTDIEAVIDGNLHNLKLTRLEAKDGEQGRYSAHGSMELDIAKQFPFDISIIMEKAKLIQLDDINATTSGELSLKGHLNEAMLTGFITANAATFNIPDQSSSVTESIDIIYINQPSTEIPPTPYKIYRPEIPLTFNIKLNISENAVINGTSLSSVWKGEGTLTGTPDAPKVNGELTAIKGKYKLRGRQLEIKQGTITFSGDLDKKITLYVIGELDIDPYTIEVIVKGPVDNPAISFRSNPPLSRKEILSWLLFNKDISDISEFQGNRLNQSMMTLSTSTDDGPDILTRIGDAIGIDRIDISGNADASQVSFELGKYVSDNTYISISRKPTGEGESKRIGIGAQEQDRQDQSNRIGIETNLGKNFKLQAEVDEDQTGQINLLWKRDY